MFLSLFGSTVDGVVALEQAATPGCILVSAAFAELLGLQTGQSVSDPVADFALAACGTLEGVGHVFGLDAPFSMDRPSMSTFMRSRPRRLSAAFVVEGLFAEGSGEVSTQP